MNKSEVNLGEAINVWIQFHGHLDFGTDEDTIIDFYLSTLTSDDKI